MARDDLYLQVCLLPENIRNNFCEYINRTADDLLYLMSLCESPIEQMFTIRLFSYIRDRKRYELEYIDGIKIASIKTQEIISINESTYRVDFVITIKDSTTQQEIKFVIECDGHDYHEKTKEQAKRDKKRDRDLTAAGYVVFRYAGSEINNNPEIVSELFKDIREVVLRRRGGD